LGRNAKDYSNLYSRYILKDLNNGSSTSLQKALTSRPHVANQCSIGGQEVLFHNESCKSMKLSKKGKHTKKCTQCSKAREAYEDEKNEKVRSYSRRRGSRDPDQSSSKRSKCR